jgi:hypothetical protein
MPPVTGARAAMISLLRRHAVGIPGRVASQGSRQQPGHTGAEEGYWCNARPALAPRGGCRRSRRPPAG